MLKAFQSYFAARDDYERLNQTNGNFIKITSACAITMKNFRPKMPQLKVENRDYALLRKLFENEQISSLLDQAKTEIQDMLNAKINVDRILI